MNRSSQVVAAPMSIPATSSEASGAVVVGAVVVVVGGTVVVVGGTVVVVGGRVVVVVAGDVEVAEEAVVIVRSASPPHAESSKAAVKQPMVKKELLVGALPIVKAQIGGGDVPNAN